MVKRVKKARKVRDDSETASSAEEETKVVTLISGDDDDAEANEDLSLKIIEKAKWRAVKQSGTVFNSVTMVTNMVDESDSELKKEKKEKKKKKKKKEEEEEEDKKKSKNIEASNDSGDNVKREKKPDTEKVADVDKVAETTPVKASDNAVLRRLLRGPRYFDPPDSSWGNCYNCGEEGHAAVSCTAAKRKKPCFVCGSLEHNAKQCTKRQDCFICKRGGHRAKDCPEKTKGGGSQNYKICLKCGDAGHDMFSCRNSYSPDDLKEIKCYVCQKFGHLCCVEYTGSGPRDVSCYKCGALGHTGLSCTGGTRRETYGGVSVISSCYRCGEEGHFARECTSSSSAKAVKRNRDWSSPKKVKLEDDMDYEVRWGGKDRKKKKILDEEEGFTSSASKTKHRKQFVGGFPSDFKAKCRGGWSTEHPGNYHKASASGGWRSPATPPSSSYTSSSYRNHSYSNSYGSTNHYQHHRFSASRFGNNINDLMHRNYDW